MQKFQFVKKKTHDSNIALFFLFVFIFFAQNDKIGMNILCGCMKILAWVHAVSTVQIIWFIHK